MFIKLTKKGASLAEKDLGGRGMAHWVALGEWSTEVSACIMQNSHSTALPYISSACF